MDQDERDKYDAEYQQCMVDNITTIRKCVVFLAAVQALAIAAVLLVALNNNG